MRRAADDELLEAIQAQRFAYVLAPRALGKSSLMGRTIRRLRADGQLAAVIDLTQISARGESADSMRWHYSIAYRIVRELRLKIDLQAWWQDKNLLSNEQRLTEFFWDVVLANTTEAVTIFFDDAERAVEFAFAGELFAAVHGCYMRRVSEPEFTRLNFVVLGAASAEQLCPDPSVSPFSDGRAIKLEDFSLAECKALAAGFEEDVATALLARIHAWTHGHPYLTQKLARGVQRKGGRLSDVDGSAHELFLKASAIHEEPLLNHMRLLLSDRSQRPRQAIAILARLSSGQEVIEDPASAAQLLLRLAGIVASDDNGMLHYRNRIVEHVFNKSWTKSMQPFSWQQPAAIAAGIAALVLLPYWYLQVLPRADIYTLSVSRDYVLTEEAHRRLQRLPGFGGRADDLLADAMVRRSSEAEAMPEVAAADSVLRSLSGRGELADRLMADFWLRQAESWARRGDRDRALINALAAAEGGLDRAIPVAAELIGDDYAQLERSFRLQVPPLAWEVDWQRRQIVVVDESHRLQRLALDSAEPAGPPTVIGAETRLTALQHVGVTRTLFIDGPGRAGNFQLRLTVEHGRTSDLLLRLRAPSGAFADVALPQRGGGLERFDITASSQNALARLSDETVTGQWELTVFDRLTGETGRLIGWGLSFPAGLESSDDEPADGIALPDPVRTEQVSVALAADARTAVAIPSRPGAGGALSVYDVASGEIIADLPIVEQPRFVDVLDRRRLLVNESNRVTLWQIETGQRLAEWTTDFGFIGPPAVSFDGGFAGIAEATVTGTALRTFRVDDGVSAGTVIGGPWIDWQLAADAAFIATLDGSRRGMVFDLPTGRRIAEFLHDHELVQLISAPTADRVIAVDINGDIFAWPLLDSRETLTARDSSYLGTTTAGYGFDAAAGRLAVWSGDANVRVHSLSDGFTEALLTHGSGDDRDLRLSADGERLVSASGRLFRAWRLEAAPRRGFDFGSVSAVALDSGGASGVIGYRSGHVRMLAAVPDAIESGRHGGGDRIGHRGSVTSLTFAAEHELAASGGSDGVVRIWNTTTGAPSRYVLRHPSGPIGMLAFSPDGGWLVSTGPSSARVWVLETGALASAVEVDGTPLAVAFAPNSRSFAVGDSAGNIFLSSPRAAGGVLALRGRSPIASLDYAPDSTLLASGSEDGHLVVWDSLAAAPVAGALEFPAAIRWVQFGDGGNELHVASGAWLHVVDRSDAGLVVRSSRLLPVALRDAASLSRVGETRFRGVTAVGGGQLVLAEIETGQRAAADADVEPTLLGRDWEQILAVSLDRATGEIVPRFR